MTFIIAEIGINHGGDVEVARTLIDTAVECGADACKFQSFSADLLEPPGSRRDMLKALELTDENFIDLKAHADKRGIQFLSTPFDVGSLLFLTETLGIKQIKISSGDIGNELLLQAASNAHTVILSTGASDIQDVRRAARFIQSQPRPNGGGLEVLHCVSAYPAPADQMNLKVIDALRSELPGVTIGLSDHTTGIVIPIAAAALGACTIEKHITLDKTMQGPDHASSLNPDEFKAMVDGIREVESAMGDGRKRVMPSETAVVQIIQARTDFRNETARQVATQAETAQLAASAAANAEPATQ